MSDSKPCIIYERKVARRETHLVFASCHSTGNDVTYPFNFQPPLPFLPSQLSDQDSCLSVLHQNCLLFAIVYGNPLGLSVLKSEFDYYCDKSPSSIVLRRHVMKAFLK